MLKFVKLQFQLWISSFSLAISVLFQPFVGLGDLSDTVTYLWRWNTQHQVAPGMEKGKRGQDKQKESILVSICECVAETDNGSVYSSKVRRICQTQQQLTGSEVAPSMLSWSRDHFSPSCPSLSYYHFHHPTKGMLPATWFVKPKAKIELSSFVRSQEKGARKCFKSGVLEMAIIWNGFVTKWISLNVWHNVYYL